MRSTRRERRLASTLRPEKRERMYDRSSVRRALLVLTASLLATAFGGCLHGVSAMEIEASITEETREELREEVTVTCPSETDGQPGDTVNCQVEGKQGGVSTTEVSIEEETYTWSQGDVLRATRREENDADSLPLPPKSCILTGAGKTLCGTDASDYCEAQDDSQLNREQEELCIDIRRKVPSSPRSP